MVLPKTLYVVARKDGEGIFFDARTDKSSQVEEDGDVVGTYQLVAKEKGKRLVDFERVK